MANPVTALTVQPVLRLAWGHSCRGKGCGTDGCELCRHSRSRRCCSGCHLRPKFVSGDYLQANCGGEPVVRLVDHTGGPFSHPPAGWKLQVCMLDNKKYTDLQTRQAGQLLRNDQLASCLITDRPMLKWETSNPATCITLPLQAGSVSLSELQCAKPMKVNENNKQSGQTTKYRLLLTITQPPSGSSTPLQLIPVTPLVSEAFTLVTTRSKGAVKSGIPLPDEPVSVLEGLGKDAVKELAKLGSSMATEGLPAHLTAVDEVGKFKQLTDWISQHPNPKCQLQLLLNATGMKLADYKKAAEHVQRSVSPDFRPRIWWWQGMDRGLLFSCKDAEVQFGAPVAWVVKGGHGMPDAVTELEAVPHGQQGVKLAVQAWQQPGHGGSWGIYWCDAADPLAEATLGQQQGLFSVKQLPAGVLAAAATPAAAPATVPSLSSLAPVVAASSSHAAVAATTVPLQLSLPVLLQSSQQQLPISPPQVLLPGQQLLLMQHQQAQLIQWHQLQIAQLQQQALARQQQVVPVTMTQQRQQQSPSLSAAASGAASSVEIASPFAAAAAVGLGTSMFAESAAPAVAAAIAEQTVPQQAMAAQATASPAVAGRAAPADSELAMQLEMEQILQQGLLDSTCTAGTAAAAGPCRSCQQQQHRAKRAASWELDNERAASRLPAFDSSCLDSMFAECLVQPPQQQRAERASSWDLDAALGLVVEEILGEDLLGSTAAVFRTIEEQQDLPGAQQQQQQQHAEAIEVPQLRQQQDEQAQDSETVVGFSLPNPELLSCFPMSLVGDEAGCLDAPFLDMACTDLATVFGGKLTDSDLVRLNDLAMSL